MVAQLPDFAKKSDVWKQWLLRRWHFCGSLAAWWGDWHWCGKWVGCTKEVQECFLMLIPFDKCHYVVMQLHKYRLGVSKQWPMAKGTSYEVAAGLASVSYASHVHHIVLGTIVHFEDWCSYVHHSQIHHRICLIQSLHFGASMAGREDGSAGNSNGWMGDLRCEDWNLVVQMR